MVLFGKRALALGLCAGLLWAGCTGCAAGTAASTQAASASSAPAGSAQADGDAPQQEASTPALVSQFIKETHPNPFTIMSETEFDAAIAELEEKWDSLPEDEAYYSLQAIVAGLGDAHTSIAFPAALAQPLLPMKLVCYDGHWVILAVSDLYPELAGKELVAINGVEIGEIRDCLSTIISHETEQWVNQQCCSYFLILHNLQYAGVTDRLDTVFITVRDYLTGEESTVAMDPLTESISDPEAISIYSPLAPTLKEDHYNYGATLLDDDMLYIQYNVCYEDPDLSMQDFADSLEEQYLADPPHKIVVDLRYNGGGLSNVIDPLLDTLDQFVAEGCQLYGLIGPGSFSSGRMNAVDLKLHGALLVGEPVGNLFAFGNITTYSLPDGNTLVCSTSDMTDTSRWPQAAYATDGLVLPDVEVVQTVPDFLNGIDSALEYVKALD